MTSFIVYDLVFLVVFTLAVVLFLYRRRENLQRQGLIYLYRTKIGIKLMDWAVNKFGRILKPMQYVVVLSGYLLMIGMLWLLVKTTWLYITSPILSQLIRAPPIAPLIPYFPELFHLESFFPPLYFTYFLVALVIVAVSHEFSHGIFARLNKIKVKTTGFVFLGPILGAFVEPDEKQMTKAKKFPQLSILAAGTFANVIMTIIFGTILILFFSFSFAPAGIQFNTYSTLPIDISSINSINGVQIANIHDVLNLNLSEDRVRITTSNGDYLASTQILEISVKSNAKQMVVFEDAPAINSNLTGAISKIGDDEIKSIEDLHNAILSHAPEDTVNIETINNGEIKNNKVKLIEKNGVPYLGIGFIDTGSNGLTGWFIKQFQKIKSPFIYYEPLFDGGIAWFIYNGLWWITVINILVALFNMLPVSILDGGRFFYLTIWGITKNEKAGRWAFKFATWFIVGLLVVMMIKWAFGFF